MRRSTKPKPPSAVIDTNLFISGVIIKRGNPHELLVQWRRGAFTLLLSDAQQAEITEVVQRPEIADKYGVTQAEREALLRRIDRRAVKVTPRRRLPVAVRDIKDKPVLAAALGGQAEYLVTGDADLLILRDDPRLGRLKIVTVRELLDTYV